MKNNHPIWIDIHKFINMNRSLFLKKTNTPFFDNDIQFHSIIRTKSFYSENKKIYTWTKRSKLFQNTHFYVYGNPWPTYDF
jgi:hypothetical protein